MRDCFLLTGGRGQVLGRVLVVDGLPGLEDVVLGDRQRGQRDVGRRLLAEQAVPGQLGLGDALVERPLRARAP